MPSSVFIVQTLLLTKNPIWKRHFISETYDIPHAEYIYDAVNK